MVLCHLSEHYLIVLLIAESDGALVLFLADARSCCPYDWCRGWWQWRYIEIITVKVFAKVNPINSIQMGNFDRAFRTLTCQYNSFCRWSGESRGDREQTEKGNSPEDSFLECFQKLSNSFFGVIVSSIVSE